MSNVFLSFCESVLELPCFESMRLLGWFFVFLAMDWEQTSNLDFDRGVLLLLSSCSLTILGEFPSFVQPQDGTIPVTIGVVNRLCKRGGDKLS